MPKKLTLNIEEKTIEKARKISHQNGKSINKLIKEYLDFLIKKMRANLQLYKSYQEYSKIEYRKMLRGKKKKCLT